MSLWATTRGLCQLQWRHNGCDGVSNHQPHDCLLNRLFRSKKKLKLRVTALCAGKSPVAGEFPAQRASNTENVSISWRHHAFFTSDFFRCPLMHISSGNRIITTIVWPRRYEPLFIAFLNSDMARGGGGGGGGSFPMKEKYLHTLHSCQYSIRWWLGDTHWRSIWTVTAISQTT